MPLILSAQERAAVATAQRQSRNVRHWRRYQAVLLRAEGIPVQQVAQGLGCTATSVSSVDTWSAADRAKGWQVFTRAGIPAPCADWMRQEKRR
jgi:transposase